MKNTKKLLVGVLSVAALLGTGVAAWTIGGGLTSHTEEAEPEIVTTVNNRDIKLVVEAKDDKIKFDSEDDLEVTYNVKAQRGDKTDVNFDPYDLTNYANIADEYKPNLTVTTKAVDKESGEELKADNPFFDYVVLPKVKTFEYDTWLASENKNLGQDITLEFTWGEDLGGLNPQVYADKNNLGLSQTEQEKWFNTLTDTLSGVKFQFVFEVKGVKGEDVPPVEETGAVTIPEVAGSELSIEGLVDGKLPVGEHTITITTDEGKVVKDNTLTVVENGEEKPVGLTENPLTRAIAHTYTAKYKFVKGATYSFKYEVTDEEVPQPTTHKVNFSVEGEGGKIEVTVGGETIETGADVEEGKTAVVTVTADSGYELDKVTVNEEAAELTESTLNVTVDKDLTIVATFVKEATTDYMTIAEVLASDEGASVDTAGKILTITGNGYFIGQGSDYVLVYDKDIDKFAVGDVVHVTGTRTNFKGYDQIGGSIVAEKLPDYDVDVNLGEPVELSDEFISNTNFEDFTNFKGYYKGDVKITSNDGTYINAQLLDQTNLDRSISFYWYAGDYDAIVKDKVYSIEGLAAGKSGAGFINFAIISAKPKDISLESLTITASSNEVAVDSTITLTPEFSPAGASGEVTYTVSGDGEVKIEGNKVTGVKEGTVRIVGKVGEIESEPIKITVTPKPEEPIGTMTTKYTMLKGDGSNTDGVTKFSDLIGDDGSNIEGTDIINDETTTVVKAYPAYADGAKFGSSKETGELNFVLKEGYQLTAIEVSAYSHGSDSVTLKIGDNVEHNLTSEFNVYTAEFNPGVTSLSIKGHKKTSCRFYIDYITFTYIEL